MSVTQADPNGFEQPRPQAKRMSSVLPLLVVAVLSGLVSVLVYSIFDTSGADKAQRDLQRSRASHTDNTPLMEGDPSSRGLAVAPPPLPTEPPSPGTALPKAVALTPEQEAWRREMENVRRMKTQMHLAALQAPLTVSVQSRSAPGAQGATPAARQNPREGGERGAGTAPEAATERYDVSDRRDKESFLESRSRSAGRTNAADAWTLAQGRLAGLPYEVKTGTVVPGIMLTGVNSDLPGKIIGQVSQNVYDSATGKHLLIPQGSRLFGVYDSRVAVGQNRVLIAWNRVIFPDGSSVDIQSMPGTDQAGYGGVEDKVDNHYFRIFGSAIIMSLISGGMAYTVDSLKPESGNTQQNQNPTMRDQMGTALAGQLGQASLQLLQQNVNIKPTLEIRPGFRFNIVLVKDLVFQAPYAPVR